MKPTDEQLAIAESSSDRLLVRALAGTGKTETVSLRAKELVPLGRTAVLTFTRTARQTIKRRLEDHRIHDVEVSTVHGLAYKLVTDFLGKGLVITDGDQELQTALCRLGLATTKGSIDQLRRAAIAEWNGMAPMIGSTFHNSERLNILLQGYRDAKRTAGTLDFDDLIVLASKLGYCTFDHLIVDEAQDSSAVQMHFIQQLSAQGTLTLVGDPNQVIYEFAGVDPAVLNLGEAWETLSLTRSFRSAKGVLRLPNQLLEGEKIHTEIAGGTVKTFTEVPDYLEMFKDMDTAILKDSFEFKQLPDAILARSRRELEPFEEVFRSLNFNVRTSWGEEVVYNPDVVLSTVHASKGSEWNKVAVIGITESGFVGCEDSLSERRLMYVALTRAKHRLELYFQSNREISESDDSETEEILEVEAIRLPWGMKL